MVAETQGSGRRILIVDDEPSLLTVMEKYLTRLGYIVSASRSAEDAWRKFEADPFGYALVLADVVLPTMSGQELMRRVLELNPDIRILICSGYPFDISALPTPNPAQAGFLQKPFAPKMLAEAVARLLDPAGASQTDSSAG